MYGYATASYVSGISFVWADVSALPSPPSLPLPPPLAPNDAGTVLYGSANGSPFNDDTATEVGDDRSW